MRPRHGLNGRPQRLLLDEDGREQQHVARDGARYRDHHAAAREQAEVGHGTSGWTDGHGDPSQPLCPQTLSPNPDALCTRARIACSSTGFVPKSCTLRFARVIPV